LKFLRACSRCIFGFGCRYASHRLYGVPKHICPTCALYEKAFVVENGSVEKEWRIVARDRRITV